MELNNNEDNDWITDEEEKMGNSDDSDDSES